MWFVFLGVGALLVQGPAASIHGHVVDATGLPLVGVIVTVQGPNAMSVTDANGNFTLALAVAARVR